MEATSIRFYVPVEIVRSVEFKEKVSEAGCSHYIANGFVQFSSDFIYLQPSSCLSDELFKYFNSITTKVTLLANGIPPEKTIKALQPKDSTGWANARKEFSLDFGSKKISGINGVNGSFNILCEGISSVEVFEIFVDFVPGFFPQVTFPFKNYLKGMKFINKIRLVFGI